MARRRAHLRLRRGHASDDVRAAASPGRAPGPQGLTALQRSVGNGAVARLLATPGGQRTIARINTSSIPALIEQGVRAAFGGGPGLAAYAFAVKDTAWQNALDYVGYGLHLGPGDALRHCSWSGLVMQRALAEQEEAESQSPGAANVGPALTRALGTPAERANRVLMAHEQAEGGTATMDSLMDQSNNASGMKMAQALWSAGKRTQQDILAQARAELDAGGLLMFNREGQLTPTARWRDVAKDTWEPGKYLDGHGIPIPPPSQ